MLITLKIRVHQLHNLLILLLITMGIKGSTPKRDLRIELLLIARIIRRRMGLSRAITVMLAVESMLLLVKFVQNFFAFLYLQLCIIEEIKLETSILSLLINLSLHFPVVKSLLNEP